ncbi:immunity 52 family protein [Pseudomonas agarici]|nr:immunity 52 family protein [Pseudomonas agarici]
MVVKIEHASFAYVDVIARIKNHKSPKTFKRIFATFPHRKCLGWMAFVPKIVTAEQLPLAAELINIPKKGTIIVAVNDPFDLTNMAHIRRTNEIEMDMVDLDLLPLTDPSFL